MAPYAWAKGKESRVTATAKTGKSTSEVKSINTVHGSADDIKYKIGGRLFIDASYYESDKKKLFSGSELGRARFNVSGKMYDDWGFKFEFDLGANEVSIKTAAISYFMHKSELTMGNHAVPFTLEYLTSSKYISFFTRSLVVEAFKSQRAVGVSYFTASKNFSFNVGLYGDGADTTKGREPINYAARVSVSPINNEDYLLHLGASGVHSMKNAKVSFSVPPETDIANKDLVDTKQIGTASTYTKYGVEFATVLGVISLQGEYLMVQVDEKSLGNPSFNGYYFFFSQFLTGERREYDKGSFEETKPNSPLNKGGTGAIEYGLRISDVNLEDPQVHGGKETNLTMGVNWIPVNNIRFMLNHTWVTSTRQGVIDEPSITQVRAQVSF